MKAMNMNYSVILYYNFAQVQDPKQWTKDHKVFCDQHQLKGRVYIAHEGINGTLSGSIDGIQAYKNWIHQTSGFEGTAFKEDYADEIPFVKLIVKVRPEIVTLKSSVPIDLTKEKGKHLSPRQWKETLESSESVQILDVRNEYESRIGHFEGAITPDAENFYDFESWLDQARLDQDKKVLMYCTGGIRCEKFSVLMEKKGFKDVYQLDGGIINYAKKENGDHFKGKCFVFDDRMTVPVKDQHPISVCEITGEPCDTFINCSNMDCNKLFICSKEGAIKMDGCCSEECRSSKRRRPFDINSYDQPFRKWYHYYSEDEWLNKRQQINDQERTVQE